MECSFIVKRFLLLQYIAGLNKLHVMSWQLTSVQNSYDKMAVKIFIKPPGCHGFSEQTGEIRGPGKWEEKTTWQAPWCVPTKCKSNNTDSGVGIFFDRAGQGRNLIHAKMKSIADILIFRTPFYSADQQNHVHHVGHEPHQILGGSYLISPPYLQSLLHQLCK